MFKKFLKLEWKAFTRSASFGTNAALKILLGIVAGIYAVMFLFLGVGAFYGIREELHTDPILVINKFLVYYILGDLILKLLIQKIPVMNIRPLMVLPITRPTIVNFSIGKTMISFFNLVHAFFFVPFTIVLLVEGYDIVGVILWHLSIAALIYSNNFLNILLNNKDNLLYIFLVIVAILAGCQYFNLFTITDYTAGFFDGLYNTKWMFLFPAIAVFGLFRTVFNYLKKNLYLDAGLAAKHDIAKTEDFTWLNQFGTVGTFLKNDIKLIRRNKRSKSTVMVSVMFLFYGLFIYTGMIESYDNMMMHMIGGLIVTGGFLFTFGQLVPSWDSAYYPLMMTQNIPYKGYLNSKWWLVVIATLISTILASFYLYFGINVYLTIVVAGIYNLGVNSHLVLLGGAYTKSPVDLNSGKGAFGDKKAFNPQALLITIPKIIVPMVLFVVGSKFISPSAGLGLVAAAGILGFALRGKVFSMIEKVYKTQKYATIEAYKQKG